MRNIKTMLRITRNSALLLTAVAGAAYMTSCSNETGLTPGQDNIEPSMGVGSYSVYSSNPNRVHNYGHGLTRNAGENTLAATFSMPTQEEVVAAASTALSIKDVPDGQGWMLNSGDYKGGSVLIDKNFGQFGCDAASKYYIAAGATLDFSGGFWGFAEGTEVYILPGGTFKVGSTLPNTMTVYNYGTLEIPAGLTVSGEIYSAVDIDAKGEVGIDGKFYSRGTLTADNVRLNGETVACAFIANNQLTINEKGQVQTTYLEAAELVMNAGKVVLEENGLAWAKVVLNPTNTDSRLTAAGERALVYAESLETSDNSTGSHMPTIFCDPNVWVVYNDVNLSESVMDDIKDQTASHIFPVSLVTDGKDAFGNTIVVDSDGTCHKSFGFTGDPEKPYGEIEDPETPEPKEPEIELIPVADIENPDVEDPFQHDHGDISATCISFGSNGVAYASFHRRGNESSDYNQNYEENKGHKGCIEKIVYEDGKFALRSFMIAPEWDFNHILADEYTNRVIAVGNHVKKGAFIASLPVNFEASTGVSDEFEYTELTTDEVLYKEESIDRPGELQKAGYKNAGDGNCVVRVGDLYYVTTFRGYRALNIDFSKAGSFTETPGSSKHIALDGKGNLSILSLDSYDKNVNESSATIKEFAADDKDFAAAKKTYSAGNNVAPIDGKNTIAYSGNDLFACLGHGGLSKNGAAFYQRGEKVPVNGMTVVGNYIFVANGSFLDVLDLNGKLLCHYHDKNLHSANYVAVDQNGFIYVAFGKSDIKIFKLGGTKVASDWYIAGK